MFNLFVDTEPGVKHMLYRLWFRDGVGHPLTMTGYKLVRDDAGFDVWHDTTTLFTRVLRGHVEEDEEEGAELVGSGVLRIRVRDFAKQLTTFRSHGPGRRQAARRARTLRLDLPRSAGRGLRVARGGGMASKRKAKRLKQAEAAGSKPTGRTHLLGALAGGAVLTVFGAEITRVWRLGMLPQSRQERRGGPAARPRPAARA